VIGDDILHDKKKFRAEEFQRSIMSGRHEGQGMWLLIQYANSFPKDLRRQIDYLFLQEFKTDKELQEIHTDFASGVIPDYDDFKFLMKKYTDNYGTLVLKLKGKPPNVFYMRAMERKHMPPGWKLGEKTMWKMAAKHEKSVEKKGAVLNYSNNLCDYRKATQAPGTTVGPFGLGRGGGGSKRGSHAGASMPKLRLG
jgi:hypothetical protein